MNEIDKIYYINLDHRTDRDNHVKYQFNNIDTKCQLTRFSAINGDTFDFSPYEYLFKNIGYVNQVYCNRVKGNSLSHFLLWEEIEKNNHKLSIILQDDVVLHPKFDHHLINIIKNIPDNAEIIWIGALKFASYSYSKRGIKPFMVPFDLNSIDNSYCQPVNESIGHSNIASYTTAYLITERGVQNLLAHYRNSGFTNCTDFDIENYLKTKKINYISIPVLCTTNPQLGSDIFNHTYKK